MWMQSNHESQCNRDHFGHKQEYGCQQLLFLNLLSKFVLHDLATGMDRCATVDVSKDESIELLTDARTLPLLLHENAKLQEKLIRWRRLL